MDFSELMSQGKVTIPVGIQKKLNLKEGDKVVFSEKENCIAIEIGVYGYKNGQFFDKGFDDPDAYDEFIRDLSDIKNSQDNKR